MRARDQFATRRRLLAAVGTATIAAAGCVGGEAASPDDDGSNDAPSFPPHDGDGPATVPPGRRCDGVCGMESAAFPAWNCQLAHADGTGAFFCSPGGLLAYLHAPDHVRANAADVVGIWIRVFETTELIEAEAAHYALENDEDEQQRGEPMGVNPRAFEEETGAIAYVAAREWLTEEDVVTFDGIDYAVAYQYNAGRIPAG